MINGSDMVVLSRWSTALEGAHDLDAVAGVQRGLRPSGARHDRAVERDRDAALPGIDRLLLEQGGQRRRAQRLVLAVDTDARRLGCLTYHSSPIRPRHRAPAGTARSRMAGSPDRPYRREPSARWRRR